jgi:hypothetical protein
MLSYIFIRFFDYINIMEAFGDKTLSVGKYIKYTNILEDASSNSKNQ